MKIGLKNINFAMLACLLILLSSCSRDKYDNEVLYNSVGFDPGSGPNQLKVTPDYFYRQAQSMMPNGGQNMPPQNMPPQMAGQGAPQGMSAPQGMPQQYSAPYYPPSYSSPPYQVYPNAGSRFYSNPYAIPPSPYYPQYDADQYYVPPTYSYGMEQSGAIRKSTIQR